MTQENNKQDGWKERIRTFSDEVLRNYMIVKLRWKISSFERKRSAQIKDLGNRIYYLIQRKKVNIPEVQPLFDTIQELDLKIRKEEERIRELIVRVDASRQLPKAKGKEAKKEEDNITSSETATPEEATFKSEKKITTKEIKKEKTDSETQEKTGTETEAADKMVRGIMSEIENKNNIGSRQTETTVISEKKTEDTIHENKGVGIEENKPESGKKETDKKIDSKSSEKRDIPFGDGRTSSSGKREF